jgi:ubiquitin carboxyl-terminal hydrolase 36/42
MLYRSPVFLDTKRASALFFSIVRITETGPSRKLDPKLAETTWVHQIFGGRLRSRVTCAECDYNSDTLDRILDLSIDIFGVNSVRDALRKFVAVDNLKGANKYKCEK